MSFAALAAAASIAAAYSPDAGCAQALCGTQALAPFFDALTRARSGGRTVHILQIGDSHSAGDAITGPWREALQTRFGSGGRGVMPPGHPFDGFLPHGVHVDQSPGWTVESTFRADPNLPPAFGVSGFRLTSTVDGAQLMLTAEPQEAFRRLVVCAETRQGGGAYTVTLGATSRQVALDAPGRRVECDTFASDAPQVQATLVTSGGPVTLTSWASFSDAGGVAVSNLGVVGAELKHFERTDDQAVGEELRAYHPDLIVLEFGTNDGFVGHFSAATFEERLREQIRRLKRLSGGAPILVMAAPDAETRRADLLHNDDEGGPPPANDSDLGAPPPSPDDDATLARMADEATLAHLADQAVADDAPQRCCTTVRAPEPRLPWYSPPALAQLRGIQKRVALSLGEAYWDWGGRMGGPGAADRWATADPPLDRGDRVHNTTAGGIRVAGLLESDLDRAYAAYKASH